MTPRVAWTLCLIAACRGEGTDHPDGPASRPASGPSSRPASGPASSGAVPESPFPDSAFTAGPTWTAEGLAGLLSGEVSPESGAPRVGEFQSWVLTVRDGKGEPVEGARIGVNGGMPAHGHGLPTRPQVSTTVGPGRYRVEGVQFNMPGNWVLLFEVRTAAGLDRIQFLLAIRPDSGAASDRETALLASLRLAAAGPPPPSPSNPVADDPRAAALGKELFFDTRLSGNGELSCATCHQPEKRFADGLARGQGMGKGLRNTPSLLGVAHGTWFYWDGRRDSLWSQALIPFEAPDEMGSSRVQVVRTVAEDPKLRRAYEAVFGRLDLPEGLPERAGPFTGGKVRAAWNRLPAGRRNAVNRTYANLGRAIAAYERTLSLEASRFDAFADAVLEGGSGKDILNESERRGFTLFSSDRTRCLRCHNGPLFTNGGFHNIGTGTFSGKDLDFGRVFGLQAALMDEFNCLGPYSDAAPEDCEALRFVDKHDNGHLEGAFKVPSLRNVAYTAPYFHDGRHATLEEVVRFYNEPDMKQDGIELQPMDLSESEIADLVAFLKTL